MDKLYLCHYITAADADDYADDARGLSMYDLAHPLGMITSNLDKARAALFAELGEQIKEDIARGDMTDMRWREIARPEINGECWELVDSAGEVHGVMVAREVEVE